MSNNSDIISNNISDIIKHMTSMSINGVINEFNNLPKPKEIIILYEPEYKPSKHIVKNNTIKKKVRFNDNRTYIK